MAKEETIVRFENVSFEYRATKPILEEVNFSIRKGMKMTLMGQNGAGKSTIFKLLTGELKCDYGKINIVNGLTIATAKQVISRDELSFTVRDFFQSKFSQKVYNIDPKIDEVLDIVNLNNIKNIYDRVLSTFSGGQQARLLLASALITSPDLLLLDEPTNNLDKAGVKHLTDFLINYKKTVIVISHDADFLNSFTDSVIYLDVFSRKIEYYIGNYNDVLKDITTRIEKENMKNAQLIKEIQAKKEKSNQFGHKGGQMRLVAKRMREKAEELEEEIVDIRKEDKTLRSFIIPVQTELIGEIINITKIKKIKDDKPIQKSVSISLKKDQHLLLSGPNGIGKSTLLENIASGNYDGSKIAQGVRVGYYRQDFSTLNFEDTVRDSLVKSMTEAGNKIDEERLRAVAANFLITGDMIKNKIGNLSEGQKGLVAFANLVLLEPGLLILDEPTNHINFRHLPIIASALNKYTGTMILVSHVPEFVAQIRIDEILDLDK